jgi:DNA-binding transcriptional MocR family regulator
MDRQSFLIVTKEVLRDNRISATAKLLFAQLLDHRNKTTGQCNPKRKTLAEKLGTSVDKVDRAAQELRRAGYLTWRRVQYTAFYEISVPQECGSERAQFRTDAEPAPHICGTDAPYPINEPYQENPSRPRAEARSRGGSPDSDFPLAPQGRSIPRKPMGLEWDPLNGKFLTKTQYDQLTWAYIFANHEAKYGS